MHRRIALLAAAGIVLAGCAGKAPSPTAAGPTTGPTSSSVGPQATKPPAGPRKLGPPPAALGILPADRRKAAPGFEITAFDGRTVTLGAFRGRPVVVNFFESW